MNQQEIAIRAEKLTKEFYVFSSNHRRTVHVLFGKRRGGVLCTALKDVDLTIHQGEKVAIIGNVGAGRTTLLKIIAGVSYPTMGTVSVHGKLQSILDLKVGFDNELTGRENIRIKGGILGWSRDEIIEREAELIQFAELEEVIDFPMKSYEAGDAARLGFAMATAVQPEILLMDQGFGVGDAIHKDRCIERIQGLLKPETTFVYVSNTGKYIKKMCDRAIILEEGKIVYDGDIKEALNLFKKEYKNIAKNEGGKNREDDFTAAYNEFTEY